MPTGIAWTDETWNPIIGCTPVSPGCDNCYAAECATRLAGPLHMPQYAGLAADGHWTGQVRFVEDSLTKPFHWRQPRRVFVNSMGDLFHQDVPDEWVDRVFAVMALCPRHTFQVLTKRPERMTDYLSDVPERLSRRLFAAVFGRHQPDGKAYRRELRRIDSDDDNLSSTFTPPFPNVWLGTTVEDQQRAAERIPHLLRSTAAVRFLSCEPLLGPVDLTFKARFGTSFVGACPMCGAEPGCNIDCLMCVAWDRIAPVDWVIIGCESGPRRRPCPLEWVEGLVVQCRDAGVACFVKQLELGGRVSHNPAEWPEHLRVRQFPGEV